MKMHDSYYRALMVKVGVIGASGYGGAELLRLCAQHPELDVVVATGDSQAGHHVATLYPSLAAAYADIAYTSYDARRARRRRRRVPRPAPRRVAGDRARAAGRVGQSIDLAADFRLTDPAPVPAVVRRGAHRARSARRRSPTASPSCTATRSRGPPASPSPGCYPMAAGLALAPLVRAGADRDHRASSSTRRAACPAPGVDKYPFCGTDEDFAAYGLLDHRHTPEIEQLIGASGALHPAPRADEPRDPRHLLRPAHADHVDSRALLGILHDAYADEPFVVVTERLAVDQGDARLQQRPRDRALRRADRLGHALCAHRQPRQGRRRRRRSSAPTSASGCPRPPACPLVGVYP